MVDLFHSYWWLLFPMAWFVFGGFSSWLNYRKQRETLKLLKTYADKGQEPPESLLRVLDKPIDADNDGPGRPTNYWSLFGLFAVLAGGFGIAAYMPETFGIDFDIRFPFTVVALVMGAVAVWALISAATTRRPRS
ncbi:hypothetical protein [Brevundimonas sp.]|uniref:hypothetical protein n=1 Tax=Brevundimonas sp. TaxID=1871086 RepID=UPI001D52DC59|nr:hypothetical protein [Brevundimonas sp.]MBL0947414.1 hypothetical protein [Brevundimonas sp.]